MNETKNVICIKWGERYPVDYVNRLCNMVFRNSKCQIDFYCFTEISKGLDKRIIVKPLPELKGNPADSRFAYRKEAGLCDNDLGGLRGQRVLFFDLDVIVVDNIDKFFDYPQGDDFVIINDWNSPGNKVGQASCYSFVVGTLGFVKEYFEAHPTEVVKQFHTASQEYLSDQVVRKFGGLKFWPDAWCRSFRFDCLPPGPLRGLVTPRIPKGAKLIIFHGSPKPHDALAGRWSTEFKIPFYKRWYKTVRPTRWIGQHWR